MLNKPTILAILAMAAQQGHATLQDWTELDAGSCNQALDILQREAHGDLFGDVNWRY